MVPVINALMPKFDFAVASKDWHPRQTVHFDKWPPHCIRATVGARFHPQLQTGGLQLIALKGTGDTDDGYSAFEATNVDLESALRMQAVEEVYVCGLTTEYCVQATARDALGFGFQVSVITDATAAVNAQAGDHEKALENMQQSGIQLLQSAEI